MGLLQLIGILLVFGVVVAFGTVAMMAVVYFPWPGIPIGLGGLAVFLAGRAYVNRYVLPLFPQGSEHR